MKIKVIEFDGEEKPIFCRAKEGKTLGELLKGYHDCIQDIKINDNFTDDWTKHVIRKKDSLVIYSKVKDAFSGILVSILISIAFQVIASLLAPTPKKPRSSKSQPALGIAGLQNTTAPGTPKFLVYGTRKVFGHIIASNISITDDGPRSDFGRHMNFSVLYFMGVGAGENTSGQIQGISDIKINGTHLCDIHGPPKANIRLGTRDQTIITGHELAHQVYSVNNEMDVIDADDKRKGILNRPYTYTCKGDKIDRVSIYFHLPQGLWAATIDGQVNQRYDLRIRRKKNTETAVDWEDLGLFSTITSRKQQGLFWKLEFDHPKPDKYDYEFRVEKQKKYTRRGSSPLILFNIQETKFVSTSYPGNALLEINGVANDQITSFESMETSAVVNGRFIDVPINGVYSKQFTRNRVWIIRDLLLDRSVGLGNRLSSTIIDNHSWLEAAKYYEQLVPGFTDTLEVRDYCDVIINDIKPGWDHIKNLLFEGRGLILPSGGKFKYIIDKDKPHELLYSHPGNIISDSLQFSRGSDDKPINTLRAEFPDIESDYKVIPTKLITDDRGDDPERPESISYASLVRKSNVSREMHFYLKKKTLIKRRWIWKSPRTEIIAEPWDISKLAYTVPKNLRGYTGIIKGMESTTSQLVTGKEIFIASGISYSAHIRHQNTVEDRTITNSTGTWSILNVSSPFSFTPIVGDIWTATQSINQMALVQTDAIEIDGEDVVITAHEHIGEVYVDELSDITALENVTGATTSPRPLLKAQGYQYTYAGNTYYQFNVAPAFDTLVGQYTTITTNTIVLETTEPPVDDWFNSASLKADIDSQRTVIDYLGNSRTAVVSAPGFLAASTIGGDYEVSWPGFAKFYGFNLEGAESIGGPWFNLETAVGTSLTLTNVQIRPITVIGSTPTNYLDITDINPGAVGDDLFVHVTNGPGNATDWVILLPPDGLASSFAIRQWKYLNNTQTAGNSFTAASITFTTIGLTTSDYKINFYPTDSTNEADLISSLPISVVVGATITSTFFRYTPVSSSDVENTTGRWITALGITETVAPLPPVYLDLTSNEEKEVSVAARFAAPLERDIKSVEVSFLRNSATGTAITPSLLTEISDYRNELLDNFLFSTFNELTNEPYGTSVFAKAASLDFFGNKSDYALSLLGTTLSSSTNEDDGFGDLDIHEETALAAFTGGSQHTLYSRTVEGGVIGSENFIETNVLLQVTPASTLSTLLSFTFKYGGINAGGLTASIADNISKIDTDTPYWLDFLISPNSSATSQVTIMRKWGDEVPLNSGLSILGGTLNIDSNLNQTLEILMDITGDTGSTVERQRAILRQFSNSE